MQRGIVVTVRAYAPVSATLAFVGSPFRKGCPMKRVLSLLTSMLLIPGMSFLSSCDSGSDSSKDDASSSKESEATPAGTVVAPVFSPAGGTYSSAQSVTLSTSTSGAAIYYTMDGSVPTESSAKYVSPVTVSATRTLKAIAVKPGMTTSSVGTASYAVSSSGSGSAIPWNGSISYGSLSYGGQTYRTVVIGTQTWMAENLNYKVDGSWWYENNADSGAKYGRLYTWAAAAKLPDSCNRVECASLVQSRHQGVCPGGWHAPSDGEWTTLAAYLGGGAVAGGKLMSTSGWSNGGNGSDAYGFRALPAGYRDYTGIFFDAGASAPFWSVSEVGADYAWLNRVYSGDDDFERYGHDKQDGYNVRCLKD